MKQHHTYDIIGIGIGPFNLGLAALASEIKDLNCIFLDQQPSFNWHPGLMLDHARMQVPFYADLVTLADPCNRFNYFNFLKSHKRLLRFGIHENNFPTRKEYNQYCNWVVSNLSNLYFGKRCEAIYYNSVQDVFIVSVRDVVSDNITIVYAKHIVIGVGTIPYIPVCFNEFTHPFVFHSSEYLFRKPSLQNKKNVCIAGSGQSAAEIFFDLLQHSEQFESLSWFTRSERFHPMDYSKLTLEMTSPDYIDYFFQLNSYKKKEVLQKQNTLYKGINFSLLSEIYDTLYLKNLEQPSDNIRIYCNAELKKIELSDTDNLLLYFYHDEEEKTFKHIGDAVILATGYTYHIPSFLEPVKELIQWTEDGLYDIKHNYSIDKKGDRLFVQNAELHTHGFNAADLGMGPYRNAIILNSILGYDYFSIETHITFQYFGIPAE